MQRSQGAVPKAGGLGEVGREGQVVPTEGPKTAGGDAVRPRQAPIWDASESRASRSSRAPRRSRPESRGGFGWEECWMSSREGSRGYMSTRRSESSAGRAGEGKRETELGKRPRDGPSAGLSALAT